MADVTIVTLCIFSCVLLFLSAPVFQPTARITKIFISHLHGDHMFGLPGLLCTLSLQNSAESSKAPVDIYGPLGLRSFLSRSLQLSHSQLLFPCAVHELVPTPDQCPAQEFRDFSGLDEDRLPDPELPGGVLQPEPGEGSYLLLEDEQLELRAFRLFHRVPSFGFVLQEKPRPGRLNVHKLKDLGVPPGPLYGKLKSGTAIVLPNGVTVSPCDVLEAPIAGRKVCVLGDCSGAVGAAAARLCCGADVLVHEATLDDGQQDKAREHGHSTPSMAAAFAKLCQAKRLVLTHFSQRYKPAAQSGNGDRDNNITELKRQAESVLGQEVTLAEDFMTIEIPMKK
ncbi:zinc phosphodiesterase ELAC protein 1 [Malurus melanocephalus]|uniref:zinc phosphodiesterase ELAC protein 1 n=1 Tax=Malurus melanocephalus TaxID=175006 RepID=UPI002549757E|nr:zinc phosphodiesterase ELAC protein 1 [Malurus melanocephalus]